MNALVLILGLYLIAVGWHGHAQAMTHEFGSDVFAGGKWLGAVIGLYVVYVILPANLKKAYTAIIGVAMLAFALKDFEKIKTELSAVYSEL